MYIVLEREREVISLRKQDYEIEREYLQDFEQECGELPCSNEEMQYQKENEEERRPAIDEKQLSYKERSRRNKERRRHLRLTRMRFLAVLIAAAWIFVIVKWLSGSLFEKSNHMVAAFSQANAGAQESILEITAKYNGSYLDEYDRKQMIYSIAKEIGLSVTEEPLKSEKNGRCEISYTKQSAAAETSIRVISLEKETADGYQTEHYVHTKINLKNSIEAVTTYKKLLESALEGIKCKDISTTIQLIGSYEGYLTVDRRNKITDEILSAMGGRIAYEHREDDLYTVYAYTGLLEEYITVEGKKINLHIAMSKDEVNYRTIVYLASPILPDTW